MNDKELTKASKFLSLVLRHKPEEIGLELDKEGWANVLELCRKSGISSSDLNEVVEKNNKKRFEFQDMFKDRVRACQGHSVEVDLKLESKEPPALLYHGTSDRFVESIKREGLKAQNRNHVHLSVDRETANKVGQRHGGRTVMFIVKASDMYECGFEFYQSTNGVWLTNYVPYQYLSFD